jgi:hypothetical protein
MMRPLKYRTHLLDVIFAFVASVAISFYEIKWNMMEWSFNPVSILTLFVAVCTYGIAWCIANLCLNVPPHVMEEQKSIPTAGISYGANIRESYERTYMLIGLVSMVFTWMTLTLSFNNF